MRLSWSKDPRQAGVPWSLRRIIRRAYREQRLEDLAHALVTPKRFGPPSAAESYGPGVAGALERLASLPLAQYDEERRLKRLERGDLSALRSGTGFEPVDYSDWAGL